MKARLLFLVQPWTAIEKVLQRLVTIEATLADILAELGNIRALMNEFLPAAADLDETPWEDDS